MTSRLNALAGLRMMVAEQEKQDEVENEEMLFQGETNGREPNEREETKPIGEDCVQEDMLAPVRVIVPDSTTAKPLRGILKKSRMQESVGKKEQMKAQCEVPPKKPNFGGSIAHALKRIKESQLGDRGENESKEPQPSAFVLEMEKQKDQLSPPVSGSFTCPEQKQEQKKEQPFFIKEQHRLMMKRSAKKSIKKRNKKSIASEKIVKNKALTEGMQHEAEPNEYVVLITNLPNKATSEQLVSVLGIWPKGGLDGIKLMTDNIGSPSGHAYLVLERHSHMMDVIRLTGLCVDGCTIRVSMSSLNTMMQDVKITETALGMTKHSKVVRVSQLPFTLGKSELIKCLDCVSFTEDDIYWKAFQKNQQNSGRGFIVLSSSKDAKKVSGKLHIAKKRKLDICQSHPEELKRFCEQNDIQVKHKELFEPFGEFKEIVSSPTKEKEVNASDKSKICDISTDHSEDDDVDCKTTNDHQISESNTDKKENLNICEDMDVEDDSVTAKADEFRKEVNTENKNSQETGKRSESLHQVNSIRITPSEIPHRHQRFNNIPNLNLPFPPTVYVRMYNVPSKATTVDIKNFFSPYLPAKIAQNLGYDIYDIEFYMVEDALFSMNRNGMLMRKNTIRLEILPGPPKPLPPRPVDGIVAGSAYPIHHMSMLHPRFGPVHKTIGFTSPQILCDVGIVNQGTTRHLEHCGIERYHRFPMSPPKNHPHSRSSEQMTLHAPKTPVCQSVGNTGKKTEIENSMNHQKPEIMVPPLTEDVTNYIIPEFNPNDPVGQALITPMQGFFCQLCTKFYTCRETAKVIHCKTEGHYEKLKEYLVKEKRKK